MQISPSGHELFPFSKSTRLPHGGRIFFTAELVREGVARLPKALKFEFKVLLTKEQLEKSALVMGSLKPSDRRQRRDELWKKTCFEVFFSARNESRYFELNVDSAGDWNIYQFESYRASMVQLPEAEQPKWCQTIVGGASAWSGEMNLAAIAPEFFADGIVMSATLVLQYNDGPCEYWAIKHVGAKPDFHLRDSFVLELG